MDCNKASSLRPWSATLTCELIISRWSHCVLFSF